MKFIFVVFTITLLINISITLQTNTEIHRKRNKANKNHSKGDLPIVPTVQSPSSLPGVQQGSPSNNNNSDSNNDNTEDSSNSQSQSNDQVRGNMNQSNQGNNQGSNSQNSNQNGNNNNNNNQAGDLNGNNNQNSNPNHVDVYQNNQNYQKQMQQEIQDHVFKFNINGNPMSCKGKECMQYVEQYPWLSNLFGLKNDLQKYYYDGDKFSRNSAYSNRHINHMKKKPKNKKKNILNIE